MRVLLTLQTKNNQIKEDEIRIYRNLSNALKNSEINYVKEIDNDYEVAHFISLNSLHLLKKVKKKNVPIVVTCFNNGEEIKLNRFGKLSLEIIRQLNIADLIIVPTESIKSILQENDIITPIEVLSPGVMEKRFNDMSELEKKCFSYYAGIPDDSLILMAQCDSNDYQDYDFFFTIAKRFPQYQLFILGKNFSEIRKSFPMEKFESCPSNLHFKHNLAEDLYKSLLINANVYFITSSYNISFESVLEAMVVKCPVIGFNNILINGLAMNKKRALLSDNKEEILDFLATLDSDRVHKVVEEAYEYASKQNYKLLAETMIKNYKVLTHK